MTQPLEIGDAAPAFELPVDDQTLRSADLRGRIVVLYFYPKDDTSGCTNQARGFTAEAEAFRQQGAVVLGVSKDSVASHRKFAQKYGLDVQLGSAADSDIIERYGAWVQKSMYGRTYMGTDRSTFLIDKEGVIRSIWRKVKVPGHVKEVLGAVRDLAGE